MRTVIMFVPTCLYPHVWAVKIQFMDNLQGFKKYTDYSSRTIQKVSTDLQFYRLVPLPLQLVDLPSLILCHCFLRQCNCHLRQFYPDCISYIATAVLDSATLVVSPIVSLPSQIVLPWFYLLVYLPAEIVSLTILDSAILVLSPSVSAG